MNTSYSDESTVAPTERGFFSFSLDSPSDRTRHGWLAIPLAAMAGGLGWGIRGQYGHETGAMISGILVGLVLLLLLDRKRPSLLAARAVALFALGISVGGSETYAQTVGLTHDSELIGDYRALAWGMLGLGIKGALWIGFGGMLFGMALGDRAYAKLEWLLLCGGLMLALWLGVELFNRPFVPKERTLPWIYFSDDWYWEPEAVHLKPRPERWGGLLLMNLSLLAYLAFGKRDRLAVRLGIIAMIGGGIGFPLGQSVQAWHAWNAAWFESLPTHHWTQYFNWWNFMETTFGCVWGAILGWGLWSSQSWLAMGRQAALERLTDCVEEATESHAEMGRGWSSAIERGLAYLHVFLIIAWDFGSFPELDRIASMALPMIILPGLATLSGRAWPYWMVLPIPLIPIAGKTVRQLVYVEGGTEMGTNGPLVGWCCYVGIPLIITWELASYFAAPQRRTMGCRSFVATSLAMLTLIYFALNHAFFHFPWPWRPWTARTPNDLVFALFALILMVVSLIFLSRGTPDDDQPSFDKAT